MKEFKDKVAVITGAASGIGRGIANRAVKEGMKVVLADIEAEKLSQTEEELKNLGANVISVVTDVSKIEDIENLANKSLDNFGEVHLLCNNAGVSIPGIIWEYNLSDWKWIINVNLWGVIHGIHIFVPLMLKQDNECHIVNTASMAGLSSVNPGNSIYTVSKHGVVVLSESLSYELKQVNSKIRVSVLCPGFVNTNVADSERNRPSEFCDSNFEPSVEKFIKIHPEYEEPVKLFFQTLKSGTSPDKVGDIVFQAIKNDEFYILTHAGYMWKKLVKVRMDRIFEGFEKNKQLLKSLEE
ncbi:MAG: SDR family NAD(P)-dependent oxidoreductase [Candidatus Hermodarchaeota archaeon]